MYQVWTDQTEERELKLSGVFDNIWEATASFSHYIQMAAQHAEYMTVKLISNNNGKQKVWAIFSFDQNNFKST